MIYQEGVMREEKRKIDKTISDVITLLSAGFERQETRDFLERVVREYSAIGDSRLYGGKHCGSDAEHEGARYIYEKLQEMGVEAEMLSFPSTRFQFNDATIVSQGMEGEIKPYACLSVPTEKEGLTEQLIDAGEGHHKFFEKRNVKDKILLMETKEAFEDGTLAACFQMYEAEKHGAAGVILYTNDFIYDEDTIRATYSAFNVGIPVVTISFNDAKWLKALLERDPETKVTLQVDTEYEVDGGVSYEVVGEIKGMTEERIIYSSHLDHFFRGVQDNVTAVATLLAIARVMKESEYRPRRNFTFVFSGSHEIGKLNSAAPDLFGIWELLNELKPEWKGKIIADINFEYTGMELNALRALTSYEVQDMYTDFLTYMPDRMKGFQHISKEVSSEEYYLLTWSDACVSLMEGIPVFMNDAAYEQIYEDSSPYIGRDHSNADNMDTYSAVAHQSTTWWYGCLGAYLDNRDVIEADYSERLKVVELTDEERRFLKGEGIESAEHDNLISIAKMLSEQIKEKLTAINDNDDFDMKRAENINAVLLRIQKTLADGTDGLTTDMPSMITVPHRVYISKGISFRNAVDAIRKDGYDTAYHKYLRMVDAVGIVDKFSEDLTLVARDYVLGRNATWNKGKCKNMFIHEDVSEENLDRTIKENLKAVEASLHDEIQCLKKTITLFKELLNLV